jgi:uncharacterized DUF497 family protein
MKFEWDEQKNQSNIDKHGLDFADAYRLFSLPMLVGLTSERNMRRSAGLALAYSTGVSLS